MKNIDKKKAFTLAETLIALVILGVVAAITIPALIQKYIEATNRTKVKKAMSAYEKALNQMVIDNDIKGAISAAEGFRTTDNCSGSSPYFKAIKYAQKNNADNLCRFQTSDRVWWDISDIEHPIIAFNEEDLDDENAKYRFVLIGYNRDGVLRINDNAYEQSLKNNDINKSYMTKLYRYVLNDDTINPICRLSNRRVSDGRYEIYEYSGDNAIIYSGCTTKNNKESCNYLSVNGGHTRIPTYNSAVDEYTTINYDKDNNIIRVKRVNAYSGDKVISYLTHEYRFDDNGKITLEISCGSDTCIKNSNNNYIEYDSFGHPEKRYIYGKLNSQYINNYDDEGKLISYSSCDKNGTNCNYTESYEYNDDGSMKSIRACNGTNCSTKDFSNEYICN